MDGLISMNGATTGTPEEIRASIAELTATLERNAAEYEKNLIATTGKSSQDFVNEHMAKIAAENEAAMVHWEELYNKPCPWRKA